MLVGRTTCESFADTVVCRRDMNMMSTKSLYLTCSTRGGGENMTPLTRRFTELRRCCRRLFFLVALTLRLVVFLSVLRPGVTDKPGAGARQQYHDVASRTIQADIVLEGRVDRVMSDPVRLMVVRVLTVYKGRRLRRRAMSVNSTGLRLAVDFSSLADAFSVAEHEQDKDDVDVVAASRITSPTSFTRGARLIVFLRRRDTDAALTHQVTSGGRRRRRSVDLYRAFTSPSAVTEFVRKTVEKFSKRRNGDYMHTQSWTWVGSIHGSGRVGSICVGLCGSPWIIQNVIMYKCNVYTI